MGFRRNAAEWWSDNSNKNMSEYDVNFRRFVGGWLPNALRGAVRELAMVLTQPFRSLHARFTAYRAEKQRALQYNATTVRLEAMLNDYLHDELAVNANGRRILVEDGAAVQPCLVYPEQEHLPVMVGMVTITSFTVWGAVPFVVKIPSELEGNQDVWNRVDRLVKRYKLLGTKHRIEYYTQAVTP